MLLKAGRDIETHTYIIVRCKVNKYDVAILKYRDPNELEDLTEGCEAEMWLAPQEDENDKALLMKEINPSWMEWAKEIGEPVYNSPLQYMQRYLNLPESKEFCEIEGEVKLSYV